MSIIGPRAPHGAVAAKPAPSGTAPLPPPSLDVVAAWHGLKLDGREFVLEHHLREGRFRCESPIVAGAVLPRVGQGDLPVTRLSKCGACDTCLAAKRAVEARKLGARLQAEIERSAVTYWVTLTYAPGSLPEDRGTSDVEDVKALVDALRRGRCRCSPQLRDKRGAPRVSKDGYPMFPSEWLPRPDPIPRGAASRRAAGFIPGDPKLRYAWVSEFGGEKGRAHIHGLFHVYAPEGCPLGAFHDAWRHGFVRLREVGKGPEDAAKLGKYLGKYMAKQREAARGFTADVRYRHLKLSQGYGR